MQQTMRQATDAPCVCLLVSGIAPSVAQPPITSYQVLVGCEGGGPKQLSREHVREFTEGRIVILPVAHMGCQGDAASPNDLRLYAKLNANPSKRAVSLWLCTYNPTCTNTFPLPKCIFNTPHLPVTAARDGRERRFKSCLSFQHSFQVCHH